MPDRGHSANYALPSVNLGHSAKYILFFPFSEPNFLWFVPTLCRLTCSIFGTIIKVIAITIRFCSFNWISSNNSYLNCKSLEKWKRWMQKWYSYYLAHVTAYFRNRPEFLRTMLMKNDRELAIQLFKNCITHKQIEKIIKLVHKSWYHM